MESLIALIRERSAYLDAHTYAAQHGAGEAIALRLMRNLDRFLHRMTNIKIAFAQIFRRIPEWYRPDKHILEVMRGGTEALVLRVMGSGLGFGFNILLAHELGAAGAGTYYLALSVASLASVVGRMGLDNTLLRFVSSYAAQMKWADVAVVYRKGMRLAVGASAAATVIVFSSATLISQRIFHEDSLTRPLQWLAFGILPSSLLALHSEILRGIARIRAAVVLQAVGVPLINVPVFILAGRSLGVQGAVISTLVSTVVILILGIALWRRATPQLRGLMGDLDTGLLVTSSLPLFWVAVMNIVISTADTVALGIWTNNSIVGIYGIVRRTSLLTSFILVAVNTVAAPKFAALYAIGDYRGLGYLARSTSRLMTIFAMPILLIFIVRPEWVLTIFGSEFAAGGPALRLLAVGDFVNVATGSVGFLLMMTGHEKLLRNSVLASMLLNLILEGIFVPAYGLVGAAWASSITLAIQNILIATIVYRKLSIVTLPLPEALYRHEKW